MSNDIQEIEARLLAQGYPERVLFADLPGQKRAGKGNVSATCPFCGREGKFSYSTEQPIARCWIASCQAEKGLNWFQYLELRQGLSFAEALQVLAQAAGVELKGFDRQSYERYQRKASALEAAQVHFEEMLTQPEGQPILDYLLRRGYSAEDIQAMHLGAYTSPQQLLAVLAEQGYSRAEVQEMGLLTQGFGTSHQLTLLWRDLAGRPVGLVARSLLSDEQLKAEGLGQKYKYSAGFAKGENLLGLERARRARQAILVEGVMDALYLAAQGLPIVASGGASLSPEQIRALELAGVKELLIAFDQDSAGQVGANRVIESLLARSAIRPFVASWDERFKDPDQLVRELGLEDGLDYFQSCLDNAEGWQSWKARYLAAQHDLTTDRGREAALEEALRFYVTLADPLLARPYQEELERLFNLERGDLAYRIAQYKSQQKQREQQARLQRLQQELAGKVSEGRLQEAEQVLETGLQELRQARGAAAPEPYLLADLEQDLARMTAGLLTGYECLRERLRIPEGALTIIAGRPGHGKTTLMLNLLLNLLEQYGSQGKRFYFYSYEEARSWLALKLIMILSGQVLHKEQNQQAYLGYLRREQPGPQPAIDNAIRQYGRLTSSGLLWLQDQALPAEDLAASIDDLASRGDTGAVFVDYIQKVPVRAERPTRQAEVARASELLREQAIKHNLPIIMGAQFNRLSQSRQDKRPQLSELREAGDLEQDANLVIGLYNEAEQQAEEEGSERPQVVSLELSILKNRGGRAGWRETLSFNAPALKITDRASKGSAWK